MGGGTGATAPGGRRVRRSRSRRMITRGFAALGIASLASVGFVVANLALIWSDNPVSHWRAANGQAEYEKLYDRAMGLLPSERVSHDVPTSFGTVRAYVLERADADADYRSRTPMLLVPGTNAPAPVWYRNVPRMMAERPVIMVDVLGQPGLSVQDRPIGTAEDQATWLTETLVALGVERVHLTGFSLGGWQAMNLAHHRPDVVQTVSLIDPAYVFTSVHPQFVVGGLLASFPLLPDSYDRLYSRWIAGGSVAAEQSPVAPLLDHGRANFAVVMPVPEQFGAAALAGIEAPVFAALAGRSVAHDIDDAIEGSRVVRDLTLTVEPDASHALHIEQEESLDRRILAFAAEHDGA